MLNIKDFGAIGDGVTDDTAAIQNALDVAGTTKGVVHASPGEYMHTGFTIPRDTTLEGEGQRGTVFRMMPNTNSVYNVKIMGPQVTIRNLCVHGGALDGNTIGNGIDCVRSGLFFTRIDGVQVHLCPGDGITMVSNHSGYVKNSSINRCDRGLVVERCVSLAIDSMDIARFYTAGLHFVGSAGMNVCSATNLYQEVSTTPPNPGASFLKFTNFRERDQVSVSDVYMYGHFSDHGNDLVGIHIDNPITKMDVVRMSRITMKDVKASLLVTNVSDPEMIGRVSLTDVTYLDGTPAAEPQEGVVVG